MYSIKNLLLSLINKKFFKKIVAYSLIIYFFYFFRDFLSTFFLIFIFSYLFYSLWNYIKTKFDTFIDRFCTVPKRWKIIKKILWLNLIIIILYILFIWIIVFIVSSLIPQLLKELSELSKTMPYITDYINEITYKLTEIKKLNSELWWTIKQIYESKDYEVILDILSRLKTAWMYLLEFILSLLLSFVFIIDRKKLSKYLLWIKKSTFSFLHKEYSIIFEKIILSFGLIFKAQAMIAWANAFLTIIWLLIIWFLHWWAYPFLLTLWLIVFICWFIPVLWVFLSSIPILIVAFTLIWWYTVIIEVLLLIFLVHLIEAYYLNPKIVSRFLEIPVSLTFMILIVSEHIFWIAWLLIWVSLFYFIVWLLRDFDEVMMKKHKIIKKQGSSKN
jgi:predicted PurR-regulated permease PerM